MSTPEGAPSGTVTKLTSEFIQPKPKSVLVEIKSTVLPVTAEMSYSWWATVDRHPYSDKQGYGTPDEAEAAARAWVVENYPNREIQVI